ncbi:MAG TPA: cell division protein FtsZ, partial [Chthoniobacteraceae bacterium]
MIEIPRPQFDFTRPRLKIFGLGGAGCNAVDRIVLDGPSEADVIAINTDIQALTGSIARAKVQIGQTVTRGLGAGGDPEVGRMAAEEGVGEILGALTDATIVFLVVGLGGGTGSGAAPAIAELAREHHAMVVVFATLPFQFEGRRRTGQAMEALEALQPFADILICFENDKMSDLVSPKASIQEAFSVADATIGQSIRALAAMTLRRGPMHMGFDEVASVVRGENVRSLFGYGESSGDNRAHEALEAALGCPFLDRGRRLRETEKILVQIAGGPDLTLNEVQILMEEVQRYVPQEAQLFFGSAVDPALTGRLAVNILTSVPAELPAEAAAPAPANRKIRPATPPPAPVRVSVPVAQPAEPAAAEEELELDLGVAESTEEFEAEGETDYAPVDLEAEA